MAPPAVKPIEQLIAEYQQAQQPQYNILDQSLQSSQQAADSQKAGLTAKKDQAFGDITQGAQNKGMYFSGFAPDQQAKYLGSTYLPGLADLENTVAAARNTVLKGKADLQTQANTSAIGENQREQTAYDSYMEELQKQQEAQAEAQRQRDFQAAESAKDRALTASQGAANRAASRSSSGGLTAYQAAELNQKQQAQYKIKTLSSGNYSAVGPNGAPISLFNYAQATGNSFLDLLKNSGSKYDRKAYNDAQGWLKMYNGDENKTLKQLQGRYGKLF